MRSRLFWLALGALAVLFVVASSATARSSAGSQIPKVGVGSPVTGDFTPSGSGDVTDEEFAGEEDGDEGPNAYAGNIVNRSFSAGVGGFVGVSGKKKAKSNPTFNTGFEGLNLYQQRYARGGNQFSVEPPDQGLCVGNGYVVEAVNDVFNVFNTSGQSVLPDNTATNIVAGFPRNVNHAVDLNSFYGYAPAINRTTGSRPSSSPTRPASTTPRRSGSSSSCSRSRPLPNGRLHGRQPPRPRGQPDVRPDRAWNIYRLDVHRRRHEHAGRLSNLGPVPRRLPAYRRRRERLLPDHERVPVARQRLQRGADLRASRRRSSPPARRA